jgi:two-component system chemotaxis response regulator CheB
MSDNWSLTSKQFDLIRELVRKVSAITINPDKREMIETRLHKRARQLNLANFKEYFYIIQHMTDKEVPFLIHLCTTHTTSFFRESAHFEFLEKDILYHLAFNKVLAKRDFRVWCAASSTGEEPYTLSMVIDQFYKENNTLPDYKIFATDIDQKSVDVGREGVYMASELKDIPSKYHAYFRKGKGEMANYVKIKDDISKRITWNTQNLFTNFQFEQKDYFDVIFVRNVFIYFTVEEIQDCVRRMSKILSPDGFLILGHSEHLNNVDAPFKLIRNSIYQNDKGGGTSAIRTFEEIQKAHEEKDRLLQSKSSEAVKILCVDDSKTIHNVLEKMFSTQPDVIIGAHAYNGQEALDLLEKGERFDVILSDINMPTMNGIELLEKQMARFKVPTLILSSFSKEDGTFYFDAMERGAVDYIQKPQSANFREIIDEIVVKIKSAPKAFKVKSQMTLSQPAIKSTSTFLEEEVRNKIVLVGSSTGGPQALEQFLHNLPGVFPPILITQHMPENFVPFFCNRLDTICDLTVQEAQDGMEIKPNNVYMSPGDRHMRIQKSGQGHRITFDTSGKYDGGPTSVDCLFESAKDIVTDKKIYAAIFTGMGQDGARGMKDLHDMGAYTIAQDEASSVVWGMAGTAVSMGAAEVVLPIGDIAKHLIDAIKKNKRVKSNF